MSMPSVQEVLLPVLNAMKDGTEHPVEEIRKRVAGELHLTDDDLKLIHPKIRQTVYVNRVAGALADFIVGKAITKKKKGVYQIAERGKGHLNSGESLTRSKARHG